MSDDVVAALLSANAAVVAAILVLLARTREKIAKLEEWQRVHERDGLCDDEDGS